MIKVSISTLRQSRSQVINGLNDARAHAQTVGNCTTTNKKGYPDQGSGEKRHRVGRSLV